MLEVSELLEKKKHNFISTFFLISIFAGVVTNFAGVLPENIKYIFYLVSIFFGFSGIFLYIISKRRIHKSDYFLFWWLFIMIYMIIIGFFKSNFFSTNFDFGTFLATDIRYVMYITIGIIFADKKYTPHFHQLIVKLGYLSILFALIALINYNFDLTRVQLGSRIGIWELPYYLWWLSGGVFAYLYPFSRLTRKNKIAGYGSLISYSVLGLLFLKRASFINTIFIIMVTEYFLYKNISGKSISKNKILKIMLLLVSIIAIFLVLSREPYFRFLIENMINRFGSQGNFLEYDRAIEANTYFKQASLTDIFLGQGLGHYFTTYRQINALHTGIFNVIYKGGLLYLFYILTILIKTIKAYVKKNELDVFSLVCLITSLSYLVSLLYEMSFTYTILIVGYSTPIAIIFKTRAVKGE